MRKTIELECLDCGHRIIKQRKTCDGMLCEKCNGHMSPIRYADPKGSGENKED